MAQPTEPQHVGDEQITLSTKSPDAPREAREQAKEYGSVFASTPLWLDDGTLIEIPPHPNLRMFDDDAQAAYERFEFELESYDRHPDIYVPEQTVKDKAGNELKLPADTRPGPLKVPHRKTDPDTGEATLLDPPYTVQVVKIALGDDYAKLRSGKVNGRRGSASDVWRIWNQQGQDVADRRRDDSKSAGSTVDGAPVPQADPA